MNPSFQRKLWLICGWVAICGVCAGSLAPLPDIPREVNFGDKFVHLASYLLLSWWFAQAYARGRWLTIALALFALGLILEILQLNLSYRSGSHADLIANTLGVALGLLVALPFKASFLQLSSAK